MVAIIIFCLVALAMLASGTAFSQEPDEEKSWVEQRAELKEALPRKVSEWRTRIERLRIVRRPRTVLSAYQADPSLWESMARFYDFIKMRELDVYEEQEGIPGFFPDRDTYYDFLDTMLPAMRDRRFERNRILCYQVHEYTALKGNRIGEDPFPRGGYQPTLCTVNSDSYTTDTACYSGNQGCRNQKDNGSCHFYDCQLRKG